MVTAAGSPMVKRYGGFDYAVPRRKGDEKNRREISGGTVKTQV